jgi:hypothetical protein
MFGNKASRNKAGVSYSGRDSGGGAENGNACDKSSNSHVSPSLWGSPWEGGDGQWYSNATCQACGANYTVITTEPSR